MRADRAEDLSRWEACSAGLPIRKARTSSLSPVPLVSPDARGLEIGPIIAGRRSFGGARAGVYFLTRQDGSELVLKLPADPVGECFMNVLMGQFCRTPAIRIAPAHSAEMDKLVRALRTFVAAHQDASDLQRAVSQTVDLIDKLTTAERRLLLMEKVPAKPLDEINTPRRRDRPDGAAEQMRDLRLLEQLGCAFIADGATLNNDRFGKWGDRNLGNMMLAPDGTLWLIDQRSVPGVSAASRIQSLLAFVEDLANLGRPDPQDRRLDRSVDCLYAIGCMVSFDIQREHGVAEVAAMVSGALRGVRTLAGLDLEAVAAAAGIGLVELDPLVLESIQSAIGACQAALPLPSAAEVLEFAERIVDRYQDALD